MVNSVYATWVSAHLLDGGARYSLAGLLTVGHNTFLKEENVNKRYKAGVEEGVRTVIMSFQEGWDDVDLVVALAALNVVPFALVIDLTLVGVDFLIVAFLEDLGLPVDETGAGADCGWGEADVFEDILGLGVGKR